MRERVAALGGSVDAGRGGAGSGSCGCRWRSVIRVLLADDQALVRAGFRALLDAQPDIEVVGEADDGAAAVRWPASCRPDVVLMDIRMPGAEGWEATRLIAGTAAAGVRVVVLTTFELDEYVFEALRSGASGFLVKDTEPAELVRAVRAVAAATRCCRRA